MMAIPAAPAMAQLFADGFESGDTTAWSAVVGAVPVTAFRMDDLDLRDPHVTTDVPLIGCFDFTDQEFPLGLGPSFNGSLATAITTDDDGDGFLDLSTLVLFRPYIADALAERVDLRSGQCTAPLAGTTCVPQPGSTVGTSTYEDRDAGLCLGPEAGTTSGYSPPVTETSGPCYVSAARNATFDLSGIEVTFEAGQHAAGWIGEPPTGLVQGLLRGFLSETAANSILLPADLPLVGGQPLSSLLPGGQGNCSGADDRDLFDGEMGWWFYFEFTATETPYSE